VQWRATCTISDSNPSDATVFTNQCDIKGGQSGSGVWDSANNIRAIVSWESSSVNGFQQLTTTRYWDALAWAGGESHFGW
jgi:V8-like Glu-specific endopeptidase